VAPAVAPSDWGRLMPGWMTPQGKEVADLDHSKHGTTYHELTHLDEKVLRQRVDLLMAHDHEPLTASDYRNELDRRETMHQNQRLESLTETLVVLTRRLHSLTIWIVVLTIVLVVLEVLRIAGVVH
jgi:hypothetical protein